MRMTLQALAAAAALAACTGPLRYDDRLAVWVEFPGDDLASRFAFAEANALDVNYAVDQATLDQAGLGSLCDLAAEHDVALRLWPLLPEASGYWPSQANADEFDAWARLLFAWAADECPRLDGLVVDLETPLYRLEELADMRAMGISDFDIAVWLLGGIDDAAFESARATFQALALDAHDRGLRLYATTLPAVADDFADGDETIAKALWTPVEGIDWDAVSFQVYRSLFDDQFTPASMEPYTSGLITSYAETIVARFGARGGMDLGTTGSGIGIAAGLASAAELQSDIAAARAAGIAVGHIAIYSLEGLDAAPDAPSWVAVPAPAAVPVCPATTDVRATFATLDLLGS